MEQVSSSFAVSNSTSRSQTFKLCWDSSILPETARQTDDTKSSIMLAESTSKLQAKENPVGLEASSALHFTQEAIEHKYGDAAV